MMPDHAAKLRLDATAMFGTSVGLRSAPGPEGRLPGTSVVVGVGVRDGVCWSDWQQVMAAGW